MSGGDLAAFGVSTVLASLISCLVGMVLGIFAKNQVSAGTVITPVLMVFMLIPMFADMIESLEEISRFIFTGIVMDMMMNIVEGNTRSRVLWESGSWRRRLWLLQCSL